MRNSLYFMFACNGFRMTAQMINWPKMMMTYFFSLASADLNGSRRTRIKSQHNAALNQKVRLKAIEKTKPY